MLRPVCLGFGAIALAGLVSTTYVSIMDSTPSDPKNMPQLRVVRFLERHPATGGCGLVVVGLGVMSATNWQPHLDSPVSILIGVVANLVGLAGLAMLVVGAWFLRVAYLRRKARREVS
jgi:hypothetical protein